MTVGSLAILLGVLFLVKHMISPRYGFDLCLEEPESNSHMIENWAILHIYPGIVAVE